jgi:hypothetical protein
VDGRHIVELLQRDGHDIRWEGACPGGEFGAAFVEWNGRAAVLKYWPYADPRRARLEHSARRISKARAAGYPTPAVIGHGRVDDWLWHLQDRAIGALVDEPLSNSIVDQLVAANERTAGCGVGGEKPWGVDLVDSLRVGLEDWCLHSVIAAHSSRARDLLDRLVAVGHRIEADDVPATDLVHCDYHHRNMLVDAGCVTAIIDIEACQDGDRRFDLVTLAYWLGLVGAEPGVAERLRDRTLVETPIELLLAYNAHMVLRSIDFYARTGRPELSDLHVDYGASVLERLGA